MTSINPLDFPDDDDDDGFDWEAAVRQIDVACQSAQSSTSLPTNSYSSHFVPPPNSSNYFSSSNNFTKKTAPCKQSTLDSFFGKGVSIGTPPRTPLVDDPNQQYWVEGNEERPCCIEIDPEAAKTWIYPVNIPLRDYQLAITKTALFSNTLVALPTGLGKTLIAAVVMFNYFRWFPNGKIVFAAPSRPLVMQQIEACHNIVGIPQEWTIDMTGQLSPTKRACFWQTKRVFFVTPQVLEKDIQAGTCLVRNLVCLVIDEAHRALGNYSYCVAVRELMAVPVQLRILALTATPGSKQQAVQNIINNLHISTLEYRTEDDSDVIPYVHNRKIELLEVVLGKDTVDVNKLLLEVIRPYVAKLTGLGLLQNRDFKTFSPPDFLNSRENFRRAPPSELHQSKYGEVEVYFAGLITLYHIRKLLSSHGIRPAYEMLEEKLKVGSFARLMTKNEDIRKVKLSMERSLSHGAPSPKLSKMLEVLTDHFKTNDCQKSRVIIFSNFRGSVRDIMDALTNIADIVKATEFIGQSTGKTLKGQSQKVQQAVLEKFRAGKYNVIVATSIGEEGLDIMEVDLVICFDANVSPLRMIQRMGRTGRKHDGRVVVLACEGSELKGYLRKQANSRAIRKHMHNGGINSFTFHPSPRMIPHIFKPEVQFVELSIEQYVPRGKKVKDDKAVETPAFIAELNAAEAGLVAKYFELPGGKAWRPSLIAFPHCQAFPSRVHKVMHSSRTDTLIDTMQYLQNLSFSREIVEDEISSGKRSGVDTVEKEGNDKEVADLLVCYDSPNTKSPEEVTDSDAWPMGKSRIQNHNVLDLRTQSTPVHSYLFGSEFLSVDVHGEVIILSVPVLPLKEAPLCFKQNSYNLTTLCKEYKKSSQLIATVAQSESNILQELEQVETVPETPLLKKTLSKEEVSVSEGLDSLKVKAPPLLIDECDNNSEMSPRLTNMIQSGIVPESPIHDVGGSSLIAPVVEETSSPLENLPRSSCSKDWLLSSGDKSGSVKQVRKFKRLRKIGEIERKMIAGDNKEESLNPKRLDKPRSDCSPHQILRGKGERKQTGNVNAFIEDEAEVSSGAEISDDEEVHQENSSYDDSFIDDRTNPTAPSTGTEAGGIDMMAVYRRSLLTQSPMERETHSYTTATPDCGTSTSKSSSAKTPHFLPTPQTKTGNKSAERNQDTLEMNMDRMSAARPCVTANFPSENETNLETRKRKLSFYKSENIPAINLEREFSLLLPGDEKESMQQCPTENCDANGEMFPDDQFFASIDLDAIEAQAAMLIRNRSELSAQKQDAVPNSNIQNFDLQNSPSFDLGIL
ncbi:DEAD-box ATP-dependent RNA helicase FANCM isoform X2 [Euphorbia lathyris]|uniref:DEAD-box ATP-dependent RNA helicase FANCM isoform X2 n=1 Tax=Euphorbia lathyris TaxID=212925 RepID=UPI003314015F